MKDTEGNARVAGILHRYLAASPDGAKVVAYRMGVGLSTLYSYAEGLVPFPAHRLPALYAATRDLALVGELLGADLVVAEAPQAEVTPTGLERSVLHVVSAAGRAVSEVTRATEDGVVTHDETQRILTTLQRLQRVVAGLAAKLGFRRAG